MQSHVHSVIKQKRESYLQERAESARIAACHPLTFTSEPAAGAAAAPQNAGARESVVREQINEMVVAPHAAVSSAASAANFMLCEGRNSPALRAEEFASKKAASDRSLPAPLTKALLDKGLAELSSGASMSIRTCMDCWKGKRLTDSDLVSTVRSFAGSSPSLSKAFADAAPKEDTESCVASLEDMLALAQLSRSAVAESRR